MRCVFLWNKLVLVLLTPIGTMIADKVFPHDTPRGLIDYFRILFTGIVVLLLWTIMTCYGIL